jgi:hypothetical protein
MLCAVGDTRKSVSALSIEQVLAEEAEAIHGTKLQTSINTLRDFATAQPAEGRRANKDADIRSGEDEDPKTVGRRMTFYRTLNKLNRAAICCSGGGIRSATFCLGVIQALAMHSLKQAPAGAATASGPSAEDISEQANRSLLSRFHYLSTVSGGGYIGSWLSAWRTRNDFSTVWRDLTSRPDGPDVEPPEIAWLRTYSNYLTPKLGIASADTWTDVAIYLRNLILNWLVIVPAVAVVVLLLKIVATFSIAVAWKAGVWWLYSIAFVGIACLIVAQAFTTGQRPPLRELRDSPLSAKTGVGEVTFLLGDLLWSLLSAVFVTIFLTSQTGSESVESLSRLFANFVSSQIGAELSLSTYTICIGSAFGTAIFAAGWLAGWRLAGWSLRCVGDFIRWSLSGLVYGALLGLGVHLFTLLRSYMDAHSIWVILISVILGVPWVLVSQLFAEMIFVGLVSYELSSDSDREWLGRSAGWIIAAATVWALTTFITFAGSHFLIDLHSWLAPYIASAGGMAGVVAALIGKSPLTSVKPNAENQGTKAIASNIALAIAGPIFAAILVVGISVVLDLLLLDDSLVKILSDGTTSPGYHLGWLGIGLIVTGIVALLASHYVNINRFSLHALYRNRLVRAYLGASRQRRCPDLFTGFDEKDNIPAWKLWPPMAGTDGRNTFCLFHVINITLNLVEAKRLAWQERKAESFTVSPLHCGAAYKGFRPSKEYGGPRVQGKPHGLSLGTAMAISGAAASPNMGYHSSPSATLLMALFNARLGWWLGNPGREGEKTYKEEGPANAIVPLAEETFGLTTDDKPYVYLSDGGHFENLGLYEMIRRRCRFVVVIDAGCDPLFTFEDLGNAVRKIYIDLGIRIRFTGIEKLKNRPPAEQLNQSRGDIPYHAFGTVGYKQADGGDCEDGLVLYIKPAVHGTDAEGAGVRSYAAAHSTFPHESTADQFFTEAQFESYRTLGIDITNSVLRGPEKIKHRTLDKILSQLASTRA